MRMWLEDEQLNARIIVHDRDTKFTESFDQIFKSSDIEIIRTPYESPIANCFSESWIGGMKREYLNHFFYVRLKHIDHMLQAYVGYYNTFRPHQSLGNVPLTMSNNPIPIRATQSSSKLDEIGAIHRHKLLGGLLDHYERQAE